MLKAPKYHLGEGYYPDSEPDLTSNDKDFLMSEEIAKLVEQEEKDKELIVRTLWKNPFLSGLGKLNKRQLIVLVECCAEKLDILENLGGDVNNDERDAKDLFWDQKCVLMECVDSNFFNKKE